MTYWVRVVDDADRGEDYWPSLEEVWQPAVSDPDIDRGAPLNYSTVWAWTFPCRTLAEATRRVLLATQTPRPLDWFIAPVWGLCHVRYERMRLPRETPGDVVIAVTRQCPLTQYRPGLGPPRAVVMAAGARSTFAETRRGRLDVTSREGRRNMASQINMLGIGALLG